MARTRQPDDARELTFAEVARRAQLVSVTIDLVGANGAARTSLQNIADAASITKAAVLYHFRTKNNVIKAAYDIVLDGLFEHMRAAIQAAPNPAAAVRACLEGQLKYLAQNPSHVRVMVESFITPEVGVDDRQNSAGRWKPLAELITAAQNNGGYDTRADPRTHAIILGGAVDALITETLIDPDFSLPDAAQQLLGLVDDLTHTSSDRMT